MIIDTWTDIYKICQSGFFSSPVSHLIGPSPGQPGLHNILSMICGLAPLVSGKKSNAKAITTTVMVENDQNVVASPIEFFSGIKHCAPINAREPLNAPAI